MVKISFQPVAGQKVEKDEVDGEQPAVLISQPHDQQVPPVMKRSSMVTLCCLTSALLVFTCSLLYACVYIYTHYIIPQVPSQSEFRCRDNYELISVPVPDFSNTHPAEIIHDFHMGLTAYHDLTLDKCYVSELNASVVMAPRNLWELLINVKRGSYLPQRYLVQEQMSVAARVSDLRPLGPFISRLCSGKDTYRLHRHGDARRVYKRALESCNRIRHFENEFVMETLICEPQ
ncbi:hypothetical protein AALO_G00206980 [Alosa alosa]|uniref:Integral membrane protein 2 n=1 Tax=Alosa alosa TaxID=278164 RepID=A0AAV6G8Y3_9TELE|nr:hypothetical protein AALO_G00206980 [Alosa alosa]